MPRVNNREAEVEIAAQRPFHNSSKSFWGTTDRFEVSAGRLPETVRAEFQEAHRDGIIDYYVMSYGTPVGWVLYDGTKVVPDAKYSQTTTIHQNIVRRAWDL